MRKQGARTIGQMRNSVVYACLKQPMKSAQWRKVVACHSQTLLSVLRKNNKLKQKISILIGCRPYLLKESILQEEAYKNIEKYKREGK